jgi:proteasome accessory factor B
VGHGTAFPTEGTADVSARKSERLMNLVICLLVARTYVSKDQIKSAVDGYRDQSDEAFEKMFERDKDELRLLGVPIEVGSRDRFFDDEIGYRIPRDQFELPEIVLEADEAAVVGLAARVWQHASLADATSAAIRKLRAAGVTVDPDAMDVVEPQLAVTESAFDAVFDATTRHAPIEFRYRPSRGRPAAVRRLEPWGMVSWHGHWYVAGHDRDRGEPRMFRLSRFDGPVRAGAGNTVERPPDLDLRALAAQLSPDTPTNAATVAVRKGSGGSLRRRATSSRPGQEGWDELQVPYSSIASLAEELTSLGSDVVAVAPPELRRTVIRHLGRLAGAVGT